jgi:hypothetical protein
MLAAPLYAHILHRLHGDNAAYGTFGRRYSQTALGPNRSRECGAHREKNGRAPAVGARLRSLRATEDQCQQIRLSQSLPHVHQRYVVAHALAHVALHHLRPGMAQAIHISQDFRLDFTQRHMTEANDFALRLLMPEPALQYAIHTMQARDVEELAHAFAVPALFVKQRMAELQLVLARPVPRQYQGFTIDLDDV